jgi:hypothetical protein
MSEIGSVMCLFLPRTLRHARHIAFEREFPEAQTAHIELADVRARPATQLAAVAVAHLELQRLRFSGDFCGGCHALVL